MQIVIVCRISGLVELIACSHLHIIGSDSAFPEVTLASNCSLHTLLNLMKVVIMYCSYASRDIHLAVANPVAASVVTAPLIKS